MNIENEDKSITTIEMLKEIEHWDDIPDDILLDNGITAHKREVILYPSKTLLTNCDGVKDITEEIIQTVYDMFWTMKLNKGIGIAAPQIGKLFRIIIINITEPVVMINPVIFKNSGKVTVNEGCLSMPGYFQDMKRYETIDVAYMDLDGNANVITASGMQAAAIQHEVDHLNGKTLADALPFSKRLALKFKWKRK